jgi:hypothetical protein
MEPEAFTIDEFCKAFRISRAHYFNMQKAGETPRVMHVGKRVIISRQAAADWVADREAAAALSTATHHERPGYREFTN